MESLTTRRRASRCKARTCCRRAPRLPARSDRWSMLARTATRAATTLRAIRPWTATGAIRLIIRMHKRMVRPCRITSPRRIRQLAFPATLPMRPRLGWARFSTIPFSGFRTTDRCAVIATPLRPTTKSSLVRIAIRSRMRTDPECRILTFARPHLRAGTIRRRGATTATRADVVPGPSLRRASAVMS